ncbi:efflux transporter outer membrane subunit [Bradyrhizobium sp. GCM10027634]|uniref:efflux transporter outer membrane subunit n=1 Tax=unclassified Bradyrhizobium TaxID=2631580 RepID=UPI001FEF0969|nr:MULTISPECIES: efflux transporter outer membrane subunit [unclassified Bradyrhizobium]MDN5003638.1 efflux transporter outer membrane subunit [Bradyrhizobium sp. WYCCWR 12677]
MMRGRALIGRYCARRAAGKAVSALALALLLADCAVGPDFVTPPPPDVTGYTPEPLTSTAAASAGSGAAQRFDSTRDLPGQWWTLFHSRALNTLVERALAANADLQAAQAALRVARENVYAQQGALFPTVDANVGGIRQLPAIGSPSDVGAGAPTFNLFTTQLNVSYSPDVFGGTRRSIEALAAQADSQRFALEATYLTLTSNLAGAAVQEASLRGQIAATQSIIKIETDIRDLLRKQRGLGAVADADVVAQEAALAQSEQALPPLRKQLAQQRDLIAALIGGFPSQALSEQFVLSGLRLPRDLPVSLPSRLVEQRPDIRAAEANLHAASAQIGVAIANRLPNITLSASAGSTAIAVDQMFTPGNNFWNVAGVATQPIFHGGTLLHRELAAKATFDQADAQYRSTVITAFQNVADSLRAIQADAVALQKAAASEKAAAKSLEISRHRLELGDINYISLLNAQQTYQQALVSLVQARAARYADTVALFQALGGGWWNRSDVEPERPLTISDVLQ